MVALSSRCLLLRSSICALCTSSCSEIPCNCCCCVCCWAVCSAACPCICACCWGNASACGCLGTCSVGGGWCTPGCCCWRWAALDLACWCAHSGDPLFHTVGGGGTFQNTHIALLGVCTSPSNCACLIEVASVTACGWLDPPMSQCCSSSLLACCSNAACSCSSELNT